MEFAKSIQSKNLVNSQKSNDMAEQNNGLVAYDSIIELDDMHEKKHSARTSTWVWVIIGILIILAILWVAHKFSSDKRHYHDKDHSHEIGYEVGRIKGKECEQTYELHELQKHERQDAMEIAYLKGCLFGKPTLEREHHGCGERRDKDCISTKFNKIDNFTVDTSTAQMVTRCG